VEVAEHFQILVVITEEVAALVVELVALILDRQVLDQVVLEQQDRVLQVALELRLILFKDEAVAVALEQ
jgi:hypothetical protein